LAVLAALLPVCISQGAAAHPNCSVSAAPALNFGTVNLLNGGPFYISGAAGLSCTSTAPATVYACLSIGTGSGGMTASNRTLSNTLAIGLEQTQASAAQIGNGTSYPMAGPFSVQLSGSAAGTLSTTVTAVMPGLQSAAPGTYVSTFSGTDFAWYVTTTASPSCAAVAGGAHGVVTGTMGVQATVAPNCSVSTPPMNFGSMGSLASGAAATSAVTVTCNEAIPVTVSMDNGATGTSPAARKMVSGGASIGYGIYLDAKGTQAWGASTGETGQITGSGSLNAYGIVPPQTTPAPATYTDVVNVTISY
jgi:outer membrane usher protein